MLRSIALTFLLGVIALAQSSGPESPAIAEGETAFYRGKINERLEVALSLTRTGGNISGSYQYASQGKLIDLQGTVLPDGKLKIAEFASARVASGEFLLAAASGQGELAGEWHSADAKRTYAVHLRKIDADRYKELVAQWRAKRELKSKSASTKQKTLFDRLTSSDPDDQMKRSEAVKEARALDPVRQQQIISQLIEALVSAPKGAHESEWRGNFAAQSLGELGEPALAPLLKVLHGSDDRARRSAASALGTIGVPALKDLIAVLDEPSLQCHGARALGEMRANAAPAVPSLIGLLRNGPLEVKKCVVWTLAVIGTKEALGALRSGLSAPALQDETLNALERIEKRASDATPEVLRLLKSNSPQTRTFAVRTLGKIAPSSPEVVAALIPFLSDAAGYTRQTAAESLGEMGPAAAPAVPLLREILHDSRNPWEARVRAAEALGKIGPAAADAVGDLIALWVDDSIYGRRIAIEAVSRVGPAGIPALMAALRDANPDIRSGAAWQLGEFRAVQATSLLIEALADEDMTVQAAASRALSKIGTPEARAAIAKAPGQPAPSELQTGQQVESPIPPAEGLRSPLKLAAKADLAGPSGISLLVTIHGSDERGDLVRIWKAVEDRFLLIKEIDSPENDPQGAAYEQPEGFRLSGEYFIHLMLRFSGTGYGHEDTFFWVAPDATLHETKFVNPIGQYQGLHDGEGVWKGEMNTFQDDACTFWFGIWKEGDGNCCPSGGEVDGHYKLIGQSSYNPETKKWSADFQIVPADFKRLAEARR